ncbi:MAG TPA: multidrug effflux MFS transporter [Acetobacteraceae bacterium]|jgi:MFS transporter, DHA1 family, multidrug resistance protein|nr:multidrug effflux MFS transporter [Acetobacteraceae bacterium]
MPIKRTSIAFTLILGALSALPPLGIDMSLPGLPAIAHSLHTSAAAAGTTLSIFLLGYAAGPLVFGPLSDRLGRRPVLLGGIALFAGAGFICCPAPSIGWVLLARFAQGIGAGIGAALPLAIVRDLFEGAAARTRLSQVTLVFSLGPLLAPTLGGAVMLLDGWRAIFFVIGAVGALLLLVSALGVAESLPHERRRSLDPRQLLMTYRHVFGHGTTVGFSLVNALSYACMFAFISGSPLVLIQGHGLSVTAFSAVFACAVCGLICAALIGGRLARHGVPSSRVLLFGLLLGAGATAALLILSLTGRDSVLAMMPLFLLSDAAYGLVGPNAVHEALVPMQPIAGLASAALRGLQIATGAAVSALVPFFYDPRSSLAMTGVMAACALGALLIYVLGLRRAAVAAGTVVATAYPPPRPSAAQS